MPLASPAASRKGGVSTSRRGLARAKVTALPSTTPPTTLRSASEGRCASSHRPGGSPASAPTLIQATVRQSASRRRA
jgi:hypothetical protein